MDPTTLPPEAQSWLMENVPAATFWLAVMAVARVWWMSTASHVCELISNILRIADKFADNGLDVRLTITNIDGGVKCPKPDTGNREDPDGR